MEELVKDKIVEWATRYAMNVTNTLMRNFWTNILFFWRIVVLGSVGGPNQQDVSHRLFCFLLFDLEVAQYMHGNERARNKCVCHFVQLI